MGNHPNRGGNRFNRASANPTAAQVVRLRAEARLDPERFGALVFKGAKTVEEWESGERRMPPDTWQLLQVKARLADMLKSGRIAPQAVLDLGLELPSDGEA